MYAVSDSNSHVASTAAVKGPDTRAVRMSPPAVAKTSTNPGPPSDCGAMTTSSPGRPRRQPAEMDSAAATAVRVSPNESGATITRITEV